MNAKGKIYHDRLMTLLLEDPEIVEEFGIEELLEFCRVARIDAPNVVTNVKRTIQKLKVEKGRFEGPSNDSDNVIRLGTQRRRGSYRATAPAATAFDEGDFETAEQSPSRFSVPQRTICNAVSATGVSKKEWLDFGDRGSGVRSRPIDYFVEHRRQQRYRD
jgi:hypothetical protein